MVFLNYSLRRRECTQEPFSKLKILTDLREIILEPWTNDTTFQTLMIIYFLPLVHP